MIKIFLNKKSNHAVSAPKIKKALSKYFSDNGIVSDSYVSVSIVGKAKMLELAKSFLGEDGILHNVLSFTESETRGKFVLPPDSLNYLGEVVVCYPKAVEEAKLENKLIEEKILELVLHGASHLLGIHHE